MSDHHTEKTEEQPAINGGATAPQNVDNPGQRTTPAANGDQDQGRMENAREDQERTIPK